MENSIIVLFEKAFWKISWNDFSFPLKWDHALFMCFSSITLGQIRNTVCCAAFSVWDTLISKWLPGQLLVHISTMNNCWSVQPEGPWSCTKARLVAVRSSPAVFVKNVKNSEVGRTSQGKSIVCLVSFNYYTAFIFFKGALTYFPKSADKVCAAEEREKKWNKVMLQALQFFSFPL